MPQLKSASSLSDICLVFISQNVKFFCNELEIGEQSDVADVTDVEEATNPFHLLPSILLEALINIITKKTQAGDKQTERFLHQLITPHLSTISLDSTMVDKIDVLYILRLATIRCKHLKTLRLYDFSYRYRDCLNFIPKFSKLQILYISSTRKISDSLSGDYFFHLLGAHCKDLRELYARNNQVSDDGIHGLCVIGNCKLIRIIDLIGNTITNQGIRTALDNLPSLKFLYHESILEGLACIAQTASDQKLPNIPKYSLSLLFFKRNAVSKSGILGQSLLLCPYITELYLILRFEGIKNADLLSILSLRAVCVLDIRHNIMLSDYEYPVQFDDGITFDGGILPLLKFFGKSLKKLKVGGFFPGICISAVIEFCPNLYSLSLWKSSIMASSENVERKQVKREFPVLKNLERLHLDGGNHLHCSFASSENLLTLLSSPSLSIVYLQFVDMLTDGILQTANNVHSFRNLKCLYIKHCNSVTKTGIDVFMQENNPLQEIVYRYCGNITRDDVTEWNAMVTKKKWHLRINAGSK